MSTAMHAERATSPTGSSSAASTASYSRYVQIFKKPPQQPSCDDPQKWSNFLARYQNGEWDGNGEQTTPKRPCTKGARQVRVEGGGVIDNYDFFAMHKYLAAPPIPKEKARIRREALLRHGFTGPQVRPSVNRYVRHAKSVFKCDFVSVSVASSDDKSTLFLGTDGSSCAHMIATNTTMCGHAMLLDEDEVFVVTDLKEDWRFQHLSDGSPSSMRFYASAPIVLSSQSDGADADTKLPVHVGRLTIMRHAPWPEFGDADAEILLDIARMTQEALENEYLQNYATLTQTMQQETVRLTYRLNQLADSEVASPEASRESQMGMLFCASKMQLPMDLLQKLTGATNVTAIDATNTHLLSSRSQVSLNSSASDSSPRTSINYGVSSSAAPIWQQRSASSNSSFSPAQDYSSWAAPPILTPSSEDNVTSPSEMGPESPSQPFRSPNEPRAQHMRHSSSMFSWGSADEESLSNTAASAPLRIITSSGDPSCTPSVTEPAQHQAVCKFFGTLKQRGLFTKPQMYKINNDSDSDDEDDVAANDEHRVRNTLGPILAKDARLCVAIPVFSNDRSQPLFLIVATWNYNKSIVLAERYFCYSIGVILGAVAFRQQASRSDRAQLDFIRSVQHELRTPLNGILGITDFLRQNLVHGDEADKLDLTQDGVLANLLESIRLSGVTLSTILDDVLDFGAVTGVAGSQRKAATRIEEVDLEREVEDVCLDELEHISMHERQDQNLRVGHRGYSAVPTLIIKVSPEVQSRFRTDRSKLKKILSKFVANALRYTDEHELVEVIVQPSQRRDSIPVLSAPSVAQDYWIDFIVRDTGMGMSKDFLVNSLLKPFSKADSFSQGVGLGVTIAASLITQLGGRFNVQSELGKGTLVHISLPLGIAAPLRVRASRNPSQIGQVRPYQVKTAAFHGFDSEGQKPIVQLMSERLAINGVTVVATNESPELVILQESVLFAPIPEDASPDAPVLPVETPYADLPHASGPRARTLVVTRTALRSRTSSALDGLTAWFFRPPFGRDSLELMDEFLREESPVVLHRVPTPTHSAKQNFDTIREARDMAQPSLVAGGGGGGSPDTDHTAPAEEKARANNAHVASSLDRSVDEAESVTTTSVKTGTTALSSVPPTTSSPPPSHTTAASVQATEAKGKTAPAPAPASSADTADTTKPFRILVVEDNPVNMKLITTLLKREKYTFVEAKDGVEAVEKYKEFAPSVVLLDISLPLLDGFGACLQMRDHALEHIPKIIAITALSSTEDKVRGLEVCGMDDWRTKPLSIKTLRTDLVAWKRDWEEAWTEAAIVPPTSTMTAVAA